CDDKLSTDERLKLRSNRQKQVSFHFIDIDSRIFSSLPLNRAYISLNTYYRLVIHKVLPGNVKKAIYIDSDVIVTGDIVELWNISLEDNYIAGALDEG
ncbi:glycosyltransferase family 8 protein, partial [Klebsiella pneumoniae]